MNAERVSTKINKDGKIIAGDEEVLERWKEYFKQLLNRDEINAQEIEESLWKRRKRSASTKQGGEQRNNLKTEK
ncbi:hypothetical protein NQ315_013842 [Exocentrus adspersus]|uniref:Uncharacterized protein n=1 Tax=Exocentrus adspersus TaxID=1586481 RepID=A0AAV8VHL3_9CUCU|nr:hypothetical protein NQ315_013842 [Exocentrus adspersus]